MLLFAIHSKHVYLYPWINTKYLSFQSLSVSSVIFHTLSDKQFYYVYVIRFSGYKYYEEDLIAIARLRGSKLRRLDVAEQDLIEGQEYKDSLEYVSKSRFIQCKINNFLLLYRVLVKNIRCCEKFCRFLWYYKKTRTSNFTIIFTHQS